MQKYRYRALDEQSRNIRGKLSAVNEVDLYQQLKTIGLELIDAKQMRQTKFNIPFFSGIKAREMIQAFVHLEQLQRAGVPLLDSLADIRDSTDSPVLRDIMTEIHRDVSEGAALSSAMARHPKYFNNVIVAMTASAEETGNIADAFAQLILFMKWSDAMKRRTIKALSYPIFTLLVFMVVFFMLMGYTVPLIVGFIRNIDLEIGWVTQSLIVTSDFLQRPAFTIPLLGLNVLNIVWILLMPFVLTFGVATAIRTSPTFKYHWGAMILRLPIVGNVARKLNLARFSRTFGALFKSGLEILRCIDTATETVNNMYLREAMKRARRQISEGASISAAMNNTGEFPSLVVRMVKIGEESGNLTHVLDQVAEFYEADVDEAVQRMIGMITPVLTIILGFIIMWIVVGVFGPIYGNFSKFM